MCAPHPPSIPLFLPSLSRSLLFPPSSLAAYYDSHMIQEYTASSGTWVVHLAQPEEGAERGAGSLNYETMPDRLIGFAMSWSQGRLYLFGGTRRECDPCPAERGFAA